MRSILAVLLLAVFSLMASFRLMATMMVHQNATVTLAKQYCPATWPSDGASCSMVGDVSRTFVAEETRIVSKSGQEWFIAPTTPATILYKADQVRYEPFGKVVAALLGLLVLVGPMGLWLLYDALRLRRRVIKRG